MAYCVEDILSQVDECALQDGDPFPSLHNGYLALAGVRLSLFASDADWGCVIETLVCNSMKSAHDAIADQLYFYGSHLRKPPGMHDDYLFHRTSDGPESHTFVSSMGPDHLTEVSPQARTVHIRDKPVPIPLTRSEYAKIGIALDYPEHIEHYELLRWLAFHYPNWLFADSREIEGGFVTPLPPLLRLDEWRHPDTQMGEIPSNLETFRMLAQVLVQRDASLYKPTEKPNTHWKHWPMSGML